MLVTGILSNGPAVILGKLVDQLVNGSAIKLAIVIPFILLLCVVILAREGLTVVFKYLIQNIATQTGKDQTVKVIERLLKVDIGGYLYQQQMALYMDASFDPLKTYQSTQTYFFRFHARFLCRIGSPRYAFTRSR